jgi:ferredoxin-NADP reductase
MQKTDKKLYTVTGTVAEAPGVSTLQLACAGRAPSYIPGQFITVYLPELGTPEGKAYSISSAPGEPLGITVSARGEFSRRLCALGPGDTFLASAPSGYFYSESATSTLVMLAAGIGIAPFRSVMLDAAKKNTARPLLLFYSNRTIADTVFDGMLGKLAAAHQSVGVNRFITREENLPVGVTRGRISAEAVLRAIGEAPDPEFFICGSISFVRDMWRGLKSAGISEDRLYTEAFFSH